MKWKEFCDSMAGALIWYGEHTRDCPKRGYEGYGIECKCGLDAYAGLAREIKQMNRNDAAKALLRGLSK